MRKKGDITRSLIISTAKELFSEKGYSAVTMKDFCERVGLSRGGLYRHFTSTMKIFISMLDLDRVNSLAELDKAISDKIPAKQMFVYFINKEKQQIQNGMGRLSIATYEFCTTEIEQKHYLNRRFESAIDMLEKLIKYGISQHEFKTCDAKETARYIIIFLEGLRLSSAVVTFSEEMIEEQLRIIYEMVIGKSE